MSKRSKHRRHTYQCPELQVSDMSLCHGFQSVPGSPALSGQELELPNVSGRFTYTVKEATSMKFRRLMEKQALRYHSDFSEQIEELERILKHNAIHHEAKLKESGDSVKQAIMKCFDDVSQFISVLTQLIEEGRELKGVRLRLGQEILHLQKTAKEKLKAINDQANKILTQTFELHEYPIPRLFIVLPNEESTSLNLVDRFRLYFLCDCDEHTKPPEDRNSKGKVLPHYIHIAPHEGYDLVRPSEFFQNFGPYILTLLKLIKYGGSVAGSVIVPMSNALLALSSAADVLKCLNKNLGQQVDAAIEFLENLSEDLNRSVDGANTGPMMETVEVNQREAVEAVDIRYLHSFLKREDKTMALGNLFRTVTAEGHVKWVCLDHYNSRYCQSKFQQLKDFIKDNCGDYDEHTGRVTIRLDSSELAEKFYATLRSSRFVHELSVNMDWATTRNDVMNLQQAIERSNLFHLELDFGGRATPWSKRFTKRLGDPIWPIVASVRLQSLVLKNVKKLFEHTIFKPTKIYLKSLDLSHQNVQRPQLKELVKNWTSLETLKVQVTDFEWAFDFFKDKGPNIVNLTFRTLDNSEVSIRRNKDTFEIVSMSLRLQTLDFPMLFNSYPVRELAILRTDTVMKQQEKFYHLFEQFATLERLELECPALQFLYMLEMVQTKWNQYPSLQQLKLVDTIGENSLETINKQDTSAAVICLNKISTREHFEGSSDNLNWLMEHHGWKIRVLELDETFSKAQVRLLLSSIEQTQKSALESLTWYISEEANDAEFFKMMQQLLDRSQSLHSNVAPIAINIKLSICTKQNSSPLRRQVAPVARLYPLLTSS
ncbi:hypothetical protein BGZ65_000774 [Modicella reniformis]|uniref:Uncharacterized protein n=1 Tax=Modicella reniformis TaxID=1440133 RepID=A0A9P6J2R9_9FUNG|nr:hypothetical protein BGZ65_000774 [Modicella reniformis]